MDRSCEEKLMELQESFQSLDAFDRLNKLIAWSAQLPEGSPELLKKENLLEGCQSKVWLTADVKREQVQICAYSDTRILRGILAILCEVFNGQPVGEILLQDVDLLERLNIGYLFSETRKNGIRSICQRIDELLAQAENKNRKGEKQ